MLRESNSATSSLPLSPLLSLSSIPSILWIRKKPRSDIRTNTLMGFARSSGRGINKRSVGRGMKVETLVLVCWPLRCPVWLIKASPWPLCVAAGMCREKVEIRLIWFKKKRKKKGSAERWKPENQKKKPAASLRRLLGVSALSRKEKIGSRLSVMMTVPVNGAACYSLVFPTCFSH